MPFANPWGLLALLAVPAIIAIHLYQRRFPPRVVAGLHLWGAEMQVRTAGRRRERLPITATLLLELLAALLLTLVLSQPRLGGLATATHLIVVLDNSASMSAVSDEGTSFRDAATEVLERRVESLERGSVVTVILTGRRPVTLAGPQAPWSEAKAALENWRPSAPRHEFHPAWDLAAQLAEESGELLFVTDHLPDGLPDEQANEVGSEGARQRDVPIPQRLEIVSVGRPVENVAIYAARWTLDPGADTGRVFLRVRNFGTRAATVTVTGTPKGRPSLFAQTVALDAGAAKSLETEVPRGLEELAIELSGANDRLAIDSRVTLIEPQRRPLRVAVALPQDDPAARATARALSAIPDLLPGTPNAADLVIAPARPLPASRRDLWWLGIGPLARSDAARKNALTPTSRHPYLLEKRNPLLEGIALDGVRWGGVQPFELDALPLVSAGGHVLLARLEGTQTRAYVLNIDFARSTLADSADWPILLKNLIDLRRDDLPGLRQWNYRLDEPIRFRPFDSDARGADLVLVSEGRSRPLVRGDVVDVPPLEQAGVYGIRAGDRSYGRFAVNFYDPGESSLTGLQQSTHTPAAEGDPTRFKLDKPYSWLTLLGIAAVIAAVLFDWRVLRRS